ncbi:hypothetical protein [Pontibacter burrus]|uniref:Uncharacterized protein n=1 Tax=Pontibacter burrus TaxID=2704466 RepID=A0A6B3LZ86_9BACT|nr:hypothetical protein [Pontibacter burrus]NEM98794.1 hypothetical protein [Pontibacter burrus]
MKILKYGWLLLAVICIADLIYSVYKPEEIYSVMLWETNIWVYRLYKLALALFLAKPFFDRKWQKSWIPVPGKSCCKL